MTKIELINRIAAETELDSPRGRYMIEQVLEGFFAVAADELAAGNSVRLSRFGRFEIIQRKQSKRRNPRTGETFIVAPRRAVSFHPSPKLTERVNDKR